MCSIS
jgi:hypothetical protein